MANAVLTLFEKKIIMHIQIEFSLRNFTYFGLSFAFIFGLAYNARAYVAGLSRLTSLL